MTPLLDELVPIAKTLNSESDDLNATISSLNGKLAALNLGFEVWSSEREGEWYGFAYTEERWQLASKFLGEDLHGNEREIVTPLLKQSRNDRIEGLSCMEEIIRLLKSKAEGNVAAIRKARELAASL